ncbi:avl9 protein [Aspergillus sclerotialis]|uniref:Avl9 protein n=1 Tax=Aspergillus sclerotialis TaxID=2070753 RepID=A0A3A2ZGZ6_9EURO|nr:avl9 protein [Aspergillus sclerotialis]
MFGPYTPLQQLDLLADSGTKSYVVGSTNSLLLQQKDRYSDILINVPQLDEDTVSISSPSLRNALSLSAADRRWIDFLTQIINETWDEAHPERPKTLGYMGSEEFIRLQFEEYLLALLSCMKYHEELDSVNTGDPTRKGKGEIQSLNIEGDPALEFNSEFLAQWQNTSNYALFKRLTSDALLFSIVEPRHPCAGGLGFDDIQRRLSQQVADLHLDERVREGREALNKHLATGQKKVSAAFNSFWADIESMREAQRKRNEEKASQSQRSSLDRGSVSSPPVTASDPSSTTSAGESSSWVAGRRAPSLDIAQAQTSVGTMSQRAGAYFSSWSSWASEKRKEWQEKRNSPTSSPNVTSPSTPTLSSVTEAKESDRGRRRSLQFHSEDSEGVSRSLSRRKRLSNIILRRESGDFSSSVRKQGSSNESSEIDTPFPKSPLSREAPIFGDSDAGSIKEPENVPVESNTDVTGGKHEPSSAADNADHSHESPQLKDTQTNSTEETKETKSDPPVSSTPQ